MKSGSAYQVEVEAPDGVPVEEVMKRFKNESRRVNVIGEVRRRRYFENYQDMLKRKEKQKHMNKRMAKFDKFTPRLADKIDPHSPVPFGEMFGQGIDDLIGQGGGFGPDSLFGSFDSPFARNPDSNVEPASKERAVGQWGSRKPPSNGVAQARSKGKNVPEAPITARARKAAQAANAQGQQSVSVPGKNVTAKGQPKQKQPTGKNAPGKPGTATPNKAAAAQSGQTAAAAAENGAQQPAQPGTAKSNGAKRHWPSSQQRKNHKQSQQTKATSPPPAKAKAQTQKKAPVAA